MTTATIKLFLPQGDTRRLRTAEISNWTGMAVASSCTYPDELRKRSEIIRSVVCFLTGLDPRSDAPMAHVGYSEEIPRRAKQSNPRAEASLLAQPARRMSTPRRRHLRSSAIHPRQSV